VTISPDLDGIARVIVGVDTHLDEHVALAIDHHGASLDQYRLATTARGWNAGPSTLAMSILLASKAPAHMARGGLGTLPSVATQSSRSTYQTDPHAVDWAKATPSTLQWRQV
jgi:hypothetical protein